MAAQQRVRLFPLTVILQFHFSVFLLPLLSGCDSGERGGGQVEHDTALLQGHLHQELQEDHRRRLPREAHHVSHKEREREREKGRDDMNIKRHVNPVKP